MSEIPPFYSESIGHVNPRHRGEIPGHVLFFADLIRESDNSKVCKYRDGQIMVIIFPDIIDIVNNYKKYEEQFNKIRPKRKLKKNPVHVCLTGHGYGADLALCVADEHRDWAYEVHAFNPTRSMAWSMDWLPNWGWQTVGLHHEHVINNNPRIAIRRATDIVYEKIIGMSDAHTIEQFS